MFVICSSLIPFPYKQMKCDGRQRSIKILIILMWARVINFLVLNELVGQKYANATVWSSKSTNINACGKHFNRLTLRIPLTFACEQAQYYRN